MIWKKWREIDDAACRTLIGGHVRALSIADTLMGERRRGAHGSSAS